MGEVLPLRAPVLRQTAQGVVAEFGVRAGYVIGMAARLPGTPADEQAALLALADEIEAVQGFGWYFPDDEPAT
jgi:hypothetical protein